MTRKRGRQEGMKRRKNEYIERMEVEKMERKRKGRPVKEKNLK